MYPTENQLENRKQQLFHIREELLQAERHLTNQLLSVEDELKAIEAIKKVI